MTKCHGQGHQKVYGKGSAHRTPQPGAEGNGEKNRERIELEPAPYESPRQDLAFEHCYDQIDERGNDNFTQGGIGQQPNRSERADGDGRANVGNVVAGLALFVMGWGFWRERFPSPRAPH